MPGVWAFDEEVHAGLQVTHAKWTKIVVWPLTSEESVRRHQPVLDEKPTEKAAPWRGPRLPDQWYVWRVHRAVKLKAISRRCRVHPIAGKFPDVLILSTWRELDQ